MMVLDGPVVFCIQRHCHLNNHLDYLAIQAYVPIHVVDSTINCQGAPHLTAAGQSSTLLCCGIYAYDPATHICCIGILRPRNSPSDICCRNLPYNPMTHMCCNGRVNVRSSGNARCCSTASYNPVSQICCGGRVSTRQSSDTFCCGNTVYHSANLECCNGQVTLAGNCINHFQPH